MTSYNRFIELQQRALFPITALAKMYDNSACDGIFFIDSFPLRVSHNKRISSHKVFRNSAARGKTSTGWFFGFKLHTIINSRGEIIDFSLTPGNVADNNAQLLEKIMKNIFGKVYGDKGYILNADLFKKIYSNGVHLVTKIRKNMKNICMDLSDKLLLKKRRVIESVGSLLKGRCNIEHSRYRKPVTLLLNVCAGLMAYAFRQNKPSINRFFGTSLGRTCINLLIPNQLNKPIQNSTMRWVFQLFEGVDFVTVTLDNVQKPFIKGLNGVRRLIVTLLGGHTFNTYIQDQLKM